MKQDAVLSIVIPCFNEVSSLKGLLEKVAAMPHDRLEIIVVDDCSTDGSRELLRDHLEPAGLVHRVLYHETNQGKGAALRSGFQAATGDVVIVQDADLEYDPAEIPGVVAPILRGEADVVYGSRFAGGQSYRVVRYWHRAGNKFLTMLSNWFSNLYLTDMETCYKAFRRDLIQQIRIEENRFGIEPEITAKLAALKCRIYEVPISYHARSYEEGKKIGWRDGVRAIICIVKYNLFR